jgi:DNA-binding CsgD family transcriptional regulator
MEIWKVIESFPNYEISTFGNIRRYTDFKTLKKGMLLSSHESKGYRRIALTHNGKERKVNVHRLVALAFLGDPPETKLLVNHKNGDRSDNRVENLEWCDHYDNHMHSIEILGNQYGEAHGSTKLSTKDVLKIHELRMSGTSPAKIARQFGVSRSQIKAILSRRLRWRELQGSPKNYPPLRINKTNP